MTATVVTEATTQTLLGTLDNGRKLVMCATTETAGAAGDVATKPLTITVGMLTRIDGFLVTKEGDTSTEGIGDLTITASGNIITVTAATGLIANEICKFRALVIGT